MVRVDDHAALPFHRGNQIKQLANTINIHLYKATYYLNDQYTNWFLETFLSSTKPCNTYRDRNKASLP
jgi:hypothetical protein